MKVQRSFRLPRTSSTMSVAAAVVLLLSARVAGATPPHIQPYRFAPKLEEALGFSRAVRAGDTLYVSGSVGQGAMPDAIRQAYERIAATLRAHGLDFSGVVSETVFTTDLAEFHRHNAVRKAYYTAHYPASSWVQVSALNTHELVVEVEVVAVFPPR